MLNGGNFDQLKNNEDVFYGRKGTFKQIMVLTRCNSVLASIILASVYRYSALEKINSEKRYDLLSRSFGINIKNPDS